MAERRMFAKTIVLSDEFLDMPMSTRCLYFTLGMFADDDGFVNNPKSIIRQIGASLDDMNVLVAKKFAIAFDDGVIVIKHWRINNLLRADRHQQTKYVEKLNELFIDEKGAYTQNPKNAVKKIGEKKTQLNEVERERPLEMSARDKRREARKNSDLPYSFDYKIRQAFHLKNCPICGCRMDMNNFMLKPTIQHNVPISLGGKHEIDNISVICKSCNTSIQNRHITDALNNEEVKQEWERICLVANPDTEYSIDKYSIDKCSLVESYKVSKQVSNLKKEESNIRACESYDEVLEGFGVFGEYRNAVFRFIAHLKVSFGIVMLNDRLENLIIKLDRSYDEDSDKVDAIDDAIVKGFKKLECE